MSTLSAAATKARIAYNAAQSTPAIPGGLRRAATAWYQAVCVIRQEGNGQRWLDDEEEAWTDWLEAVDRYGKTGTELDPRVQITQQDRLF